MGSDARSQPSPTEALATWSLPAALVTSHSLTLAEACKCPTTDGQQNRLSLPEDNPDVFELFVDFMYYGSYATNCHTNLETLAAHSMDTQAWVLGDALKSTSFKNHAMGRLHAGATEPFTWSVTPPTMVYVCKNTATGSRLRQFFFDYTCLHFSDSSRVTGDTELWDRVLLDHADFRSHLLQQFRKKTDERHAIHALEEYLEAVKEVDRSTTFRTDNSQALALGKEKTDEELVKSEPTED